MASDGTVAQIGKAQTPMSNRPIRPILVCMVWRGGERFDRALASIAQTLPHFDRVVLSITGSKFGEDMARATAFQEIHPDVEVICTGEEWPTMRHQAFWIDYLVRSGATPQDWIYWLAYDDEIRARGIDAIVNDAGSWPLVPGTAYFGPWAMRHEQPEQLWTGDPRERLESWTSFPVEGPTELAVEQWIAEQLRQPTYMQMSGSVNALQSFIDLRDLRPRKRGPMRIEMAVASARGSRSVAEFSEPVSIIYGRSNSDRAAYGKRARKEDMHLATWLARYSLRHPRAAKSLAMATLIAAGSTIAAAAGMKDLPTEEWRVRGTLTP